MKLEELLKSKIFKISSIIIISTLSLLIVFELGILIGRKQGDFSNKYERNYFNNFTRPMGFPDKPNIIQFNRLPNPHGITGGIIKIGENEFVLKDNIDEIEKIIIVSDKTEIRSGKYKIQFSDLKIDDKAIIIGNPDNQGRIQSEIIRIFNGTLKDSKEIKIRDF